MRSAPFPTKPLRVCIDARLVDGAAGGVQQTLIGLASGLAALEDDGSEYLFLAYKDSTAWLQPHLGPSARIIGFDRQVPRRALRRIVRALLPADVLERSWSEVFSRLPIRLPESDGTVEREGADVVHFAIQQGFRTTVPSVFVPHDLQHRHFPEFFTRYELKWRETYYRTLCDHAARIVALSHHGKRDLIEQFGIDPEKIHVVGWAPALDAYDAPGAAEIGDARKRLGLPERFAFYPAQSFPHKNHLRLLDALAALRDRHGLEVPLVCSGHQNDAFAPIQRRIRRLRLDALVRFIGFVDPRDVACLYRSAQLVVFPSLFEGFGMPVLEAFRSGTPVACSQTTSLPEIAGGAALLFDPGDVDAIAAAIRRLWTDPELRGVLACRGKQRVATASWTRTARSYRALYRLVGGRVLTDKDKAFLQQSREGDDSTRRTEGA